MSSLSNLLLEIVNEYGRFVQNYTGINKPDDMRSELQRKNLQELEKHFALNHVNEVTNINCETIKLLGLLQKKCNHNIEPILTYLEESEHGWCGGEYKSRNKCGWCRQNTADITWFFDTGSTDEAIDFIRRIFHDKEFGWITLLAFCYCLASLFMSKLTRNSRPLFLQIACDNNSLMHELLCEIATICDANIGFYENCRNINRRSCGNDRHKTIIPTAFDTTIKNLSSLRDTPVIISGHNAYAVSYKALLREIANMLNCRKDLELTGVLPLAVCSELKVRPDEFLNLDLTEVQMCKEYLNLVKEARPMLMTVVSYFMKNFVICLFAPEKWENADEKFRTGNYPFVEIIDNSIQSVKGFAHNAMYAQNIGVLKFFYAGFIRAFEMLYNRQKYKIGEEAVIDAVRSGQKTWQTASLLREVDKSLIETHKQYVPISEELLKVELIGITSDNESVTIKRAKKYASRITKAYLALKVPIYIPKVIVKGERYIFTVKLTDGTRSRKFFKECEDARMATGFEYFKPLKENLEYKIVASKKKLEENSLIKILSDPTFKNSKAKIPFAMGYDIMGDMVVEDAADFIHTLFAGSSGSGKSTSLHCLLMSLVTQSIDKVNILIFDFGITYLSEFANIPHLSHPIITDMPTGVEVIMKLKDEMERRRKLYSSNRKEFDTLPKIYCVIDEWPKFIRHGEDAQAKKDLENAVTGLMEQARGVGIFMVGAAQDPTEKKMKCGMTNFGTVLGFRCRRKNNSEVMIGEPGAEELLGKGDMLFKCENRAGLRNIQGAYIDEKDIAPILKTMLAERNFQSEGRYKFNMVTFENSGNSVVAKKLSAEDEIEKNLVEVILELLDKGKTSNDEVQKLIGVGYHKANDYMQNLEEFGLVPTLGSKRGPRKLLPAWLDTVSSECLELLESHGYSEEDLENAFISRD